MRATRTFFVAMVCAMFCAVLAGCGDDALLVHVGGTMRPVMQHLAKLYEQETGQKIEINNAGSGELLATIEGQKEGDLYVCHDPFLDILMQKKLGVDGWTVAELTPVIAVWKGNPKAITGVADLAKPDVDLFLTDYQRSTLGRMLGTIFGKAGVDLAKLNREKQINTHKSGGHAANMVVTKNADATIVWRAVWHLRRGDLDKVEIPAHVPIDYVDTITSATKKVWPLMPVRVTVATLKCADKPKAAAKFADFLVSERAQKIFEDWGFTMNSERIRKEYAAGVKIQR